MRRRPNRILVCLSTSIALMLVLAADVRACPWLITTIALPKPTDDGKSADGSADPAAKPPVQNSQPQAPVAHGSTLPDEALPRHAGPPGEAPQRGARDGTGLHLRGAQIDPAFVLVRDLPYPAALLFHVPSPLARLARLGVPCSAAPRRAAGWLSTVLPLGPPRS